MLTTVMSAGLGACNRRPDAYNGLSDSALADSAALYEQESIMLRKVGQTPNLQGPESARYDRDLDVWFVSNINGTPLAEGQQRIHQPAPARRGALLASNSSRAARRASP